MKTFFFSTVLLTTYMVLNLKIIALSKLNKMKTDTVILPITHFIVTLIQTPYSHLFEYFF